MGVWCDCYQLFVFQARRNRCLNDGDDHSVVNDRQMERFFAREREGRRQNSTVEVMTLGVHVSALDNSPARPL